MFLHVFPLGVVLISRVDVIPGNFPTAGSIARLDLTRGLEAMQLVLGAREVLRPAGDTKLRFIIS